MENILNYKNDQLSLFPCQNGVRDQINADK